MRDRAKHARRVTREGRVTREKTEELLFARVLEITMCYTEIFLLVIIFQGFKCFGIQFYGECWSGLNACDTYKKYGPSDECFCTSDVSLNSTFPKYQPPENCLGPVGGRWANFVYKLHEV